VDDYKWVEPGDLQRDLGRHPGRYTPWFRLAFSEVVSHLTTCLMPGAGDRTVVDPNL
ncbi:MAG: hypothetical protein JO329_12115, partial [Planctomycetaceae bacterium]|nr:hypothetical protein [Planctomycetaceae bacterium]